MALLTALVRVYFELSYRLLLDSAGGRAFLARALRLRSRRRRTLDRNLVRAPSVTPRGRLAMLLVLGEESVVSTLAARGRLRRWRLVVRRDGRADQPRPGRADQPRPPIGT